MDGENGDGAPGSGDEIRECGMDMSTGKLKLTSDPVKSKVWGLSTSKSEESPRWDAEDEDRLGEMSDTDIEV